VALPVVGFVAGRTFSEDALRANPPPAVTIVRSVDKPCAPCPTCAAAPTLAATAPPAPAPTTAVSAATSSGPTPAPGEGLLVVECVPSCVAIVLDGKERGPSPLAGVSLPPGKHKLFGKFAAGSPKLADAVIVAGQTTRISLSPGAAPSEEPAVPRGGGEGCNPPYWEQEDGTRITKPACR